MKSKKFSAFNKSIKVTFQEEVLVLPHPVSQSDVDTVPAPAWPLVHFWKIKTVMNLYFSVCHKMPTLRMETPTRIKRTSCLRPPRRPNRLKTGKKAGGRSGLTPPPPPPCREVKARAAPEIASCRARRWACRSSTPPTCCWRRCRARWSCCPSRCSSWPRRSRSLCASRCTSSGTWCRFSETSQGAPSHSCMTSWTGGRRYSAAAALHHRQYTRPSGAGSVEASRRSIPLAALLFDRTEKSFCGYILKLYLKCYNGRYVCLAFPENGKGKISLITKEHGDFVCYWKWG